MKKIITALTIIAAALLVLLAVLLVLGDGVQPSREPETAGGQNTPAPQIQGNTPPAPTPPQPTEPPAPPKPPFQVQMSDSTDPAKFDITWEIMADGEIVESYIREEPICFEDGDYFALPGIASFRGGNYRNDPTYGTADITDGSIKQLWSMNIGNFPGETWCGCGWTGQPLVVQWDAQTRSIMNLHENKKDKEDLVEVVYAKMDGWVHFFDIEDGTETRDPINLGMVFKGSGALDPRGYPLLYVGSGISTNGMVQRIFVVSLIDGSVLYEFSGYDTFSKRGWYAFDSSPLVDAQTDTLLYPCESGVLYSIKLNTQYDKEAGTISVTPDEPVKTRYTSTYSQKGRYLGYESSMVAVENYLYIGDNAGLLQCVDVNTMELMWAQDIVDDINATPAFEWGEDGKGYLYIAPSLDYSGNRTKNDLPMYKLDAQTGEILWSQSVECSTYDDISGGALASPLLGRAGTDVEDLVYFGMGRSPSAWAGQLLAMNKETGEVVWKVETENYMWSSPVALYTQEGKAYIFQADASGNCSLYDGLTGELLDTVALNRTVEASPVVFGNRVVLGTRGGIHLFEIS